MYFIAATIQMYLLQRISNDGAMLHWYFQLRLFLAKPIQEL
jgi:hypothetical protein